MLRSEFEVARLVAELSRRGLVIAVHHPELEAAELRPRNFFSLDLGPAALLPLAFAFAAVLMLFCWRHYVGPLVHDTGRIFSPVLNAGRSNETVDRLRLQRLLKAFQLYRDERGTPPSSLAALARLGYCSDSDLETADGNRFVLRVIGRREDMIVISALDNRGEPRPDLTVEISIQ
jgi:hypothetical protein